MKAFIKAFGVHPLPDRFRREYDDAGIEAGQELTA